MAWLIFYLAYTFFVRRPKNRYLISFILFLTFLDVSVIAYHHARLVIWPNSAAVEPVKIEQIGINNSPSSLYASKLLKLKSKIKLENSEYFKPVENMPRFSFYSQNPQPSLQALPLAVQQVAKTYNKEQISFTAPAAGYLVRKESFFPYWQATVNGAATQVEKVFHHIQKIPIAKGANRVTFSFHRPWLMILILINIAQFLLLGGIWLKTKENNLA